MFIINKRSLNVVSDYVVTARGFAETARDASLSPWGNVVPRGFMCFVAQLPSSPQLAQLHKLAQQLGKLAQIAQLGTILPSQKNTYRVLMCVLNFAPFPFAFERSRCVNFVERSLWLVKRKKWNSTQVFAK